MEMAVKTAAHLIAIQQLQNLRALVALVPRWVVKEHQLGQFPRCFQRCFQANELSLEYLLVVLGAALFLKVPATGAAEGVSALFIKIVVQDLHLGKAVFLAEFLKFGNG